MNKLIATVTLFFSVSFLHAQLGYVRFVKNTEIQGKKFFTGEIYPILKVTSEQKPSYYINSGLDTFKIDKNVEKLQTNPEDRTALKNDLIKSKEGGLIHIDVSSVSNGNDTIWFVNEKNEKIPLLNKSVVDEPQADAGKSFRLIIPNSLTVYYSIDSLTKVIPPDIDSDGDGVIDSKDSCPSEVGTIENNGCPEITKNSWSWWVWTIVILGTLSVIFLSWFLWKKYKLKPNEVIFKSNSLTDFADLYGGLDKLNSLNSSLVPTKSEWNKLKHDDKAKKDKLKELKGKRIIIRGNNDASFGFQDSHSQKQFEQPEKEWNNSKEASMHSNSLGDSPILGDQLQRMESAIIREIQKSRLTSDKSSEIEKIKGEKLVLDGKINGLETEKKDLTTTLEQLKADKLTIENNLQLINTEKQEILSEIRELKERVISVDFLKSYCENVFSYLIFCQQASNNAYNFFSKVSQQNIKQGFAAGHLLMKFQNSINTLPLGNWVQTLQDINESGTTTNRKLIRSFAQIQNDNGKLSEFQRLVFSEVLIKYSSSILILSESFKNIARFQVSSDLAIEAKNTFSRYVSEIISKAKLTGIEIKYVPLFDNWESHIGEIENIDSERSWAYKEVNDLEKGSIAEIVSYGVKTAFDDTKTIIILA